MAQLPQALHAGAARRTIKSMDWQFAAGFGTAVVFFFVPYVAKDMPAYVTWPGIVTGLLFIFWGMLPNHERIPVGPAVLFIASIAGTVASCLWYRDITNVPDQAVTVGRPQQDIDHVPAQPPSLFSLFMNDLQPANGVRWDAFTDFELNGAVQSTCFL